MHNPGIPFRVIHCVSSWQVRPRANLLREIRQVKGRKASARTAAGTGRRQMMAGFLTGPSGGPAVFVAPMWSGDPAVGKSVVAPLSRLGTPLYAGSSPYPEHLRMFDAGMAEGNRYALGTRWLTELTDDTSRRWPRAPSPARRHSRCSPSISSMAPLHVSPRTRSRSRFAGTNCSTR